MEAVVQQLATISSAISELRVGMKQLKDNVDDKFKQLDSKINNLEGKRDTQINEIIKEIDGLKLGTSENVEKKDGASGKELDIKLEKTSKETKEKIQSIEKLSTEMFERIFHNETTLQQKMTQMSSTVEEMKTRMASMTLEEKTPEFKKLEAETYDWLITDVHNRFKLNNSEYESEVFTFIGYKYEIKAKLQKTDGKYNIDLQFKSGSTLNRQVEKHGFTEVRYAVRDQVYGDQKKDITLAAPLVFCTSVRASEWLFRQELPDLMLLPPYTMDNCVKITMTFVPPSIDRSFVSSNGVLMWKVDNYRRKKQERMNTPIWSPSFYTSPQGYRVRIRLVIYYEGAMSAIVHFLTGEHDQSLPRTFPHKTTVTLFNHVDPSRNVVKYAQNEHLNRYQLHLGNGTIFEQEDGFIINDSFLIKVVIEPGTFTQSPHSSQEVTKHK